jgi:hypothetical protein
MTAQTTALLRNPHPQCHIVYPYADDHSVGEAVGLYAEAGLRNGEAVVLIATRERRERIADYLKRQLVDVDDFARSGLLLVFDAGELLSQLFCDDVPDAALFEDVIGHIIQTAKKNTLSGKIRLYGEMVNLLCGKNDLQSAARVESWWNEIIDAESVPLLCSYSADLLAPHSATGLPKALMDAHSHIAAA